MSQSILPAEGVASRALDASHRVPALMRCAVALVFVVAALRVLGFAQAIRLVRWMTRRIELASDAPFEAAETIARRVALTAAFYPGRARCLEQSITLYWLLRWARMDAVLKMGVQPVGFAAHAWVEYRGAPVLESEMVRTVHPFPELSL